MITASLEAAGSINWSGCTWVESDPERLGGTPVVVNTRMEASGVLENFDDGLSVEEICYHFFLDEDAVRAVLAYAGRLDETDAL